MQETKENFQISLFDILGVFYGDITSIKQESLKKEKMGKLEYRKALGNTIALNRLEEDRIISYLLRSQRLFYLCAFTKKPLEHFFKYLVFHNIKTIIISLRNIYDLCEQII